MKKKKLEAELDQQRQWTDHFRKDAEEYRAKLKVSRDDAMAIHRKAVDLAVGGKGALTQIEEWKKLYWEVRAQLELMQYWRVVDEDEGDDG